MKRNSCFSFPAIAIKVSSLFALGGGFHLEENNTYLTKANVYWYDATISTARSSKRRENVEIGFEAERNRNNKTKMAVFLFFHKVLVVVFENLNMVIPDTKKLFRDRLSRFFQNCCSILAYVAIARILRQSKRKRKIQNRTLRFVWKAPENDGGCTPSVSEEG
jgi:hypothetical protein